MNPQLSAILAFVVVIILIGGGYSLLSGGGSKSSIPPGADAATYRQLIVPGAPQSSCSYGKDKNWVFYGDSIVPGADSKTFTFIDRYYAKDVNHVYYLNTCNSVPEIVPGDPSTFKNLGGNGLYTLDQTSVYWENTPIANADPSTFVELYVGNTPTVYGKDATTVYHAGTVIEGADVHTFHIISIDSTSSSGGADGYAADSTSVFYDGAVIPGANPDTFVSPDSTTTTTTTTSSTDTTTSTASSTNQTATNSTTTTQTTDATQTQNTGTTFTDLFTGFSLYTMPSGSTNAYFDPNATVKNPNGF